MDKADKGDKKFKKKFGQFIMAIALILWGGYIYTGGKKFDKTEGVLFIIVGLVYLFYGIVINQKERKNNRP